MIEPDGWEKNNEAYLAAAFNWMRLRLMSLTPPGTETSAGGHSAEEHEQEQGDAETGYWSNYQKRNTKTMMSSFTQTNSGTQTNSAAKNSAALLPQMTEAGARFEAAQNVDPPPALVIISQRMGLSRFEQEILLLCAGFELDTRFAGLFAQAHDDRNKPFPTFGLALALSEEPLWDALSPRRPLRYLHLLDINQPPTQTLLASALRIDERILNFIKGLNEFDARLAPLLFPLDMPEVRLAPSQQALADDILRDLQHASLNGASKIPLLELAGIDGTSKQLIASYVADKFNLLTYRLPVDLLPSNPAELEILSRLWQREILLHPVALYLDAREVDLETQPATALRQFIDQCPGLKFLDTRAPWNSLSENVAVFDITSPMPAEQKEAWKMSLGEEPGDSADSSAADSTGDKTEKELLAAQLADQFNLNLPSIDRIAKSALADRAEGAVLRDAAWKMCLAGTRPRLDMLAQRIDAKATWEEIVLPDEVAKLLKQIVEQVTQRGRVYDDWGFRRRMNRGLGISVLFAGESGTGKTMAAEVMANELDLNLYRIDLSAVVSKYIGETEKNLRRLFDTAEEGGAILFFDEADAIFGRRSEVKDSHDRYANIEVNYLLQRLESYRGLSILATNMKNALDTAFMRRLRFMVDFPFPGPAARKDIWGKVFPPDTPQAALDFEGLGKFNLSGGSIHNIALNAAFRATNTKERRVTMPLILEGVRAEFSKLSIPLNEADFCGFDDARKAKQ